MISFVFITYNLTDNITSANRYKSIAAELLKKKEVDLNIVEIPFLKEGNTSFRDIKNTDNLEKSIQDLMVPYCPRLNIFQKIVLRANSKLLKFFYLLVNKKDVYSPTDLKQAYNLLNRNLIGYVLLSGGPFGFFTFGADLARLLGYKLILDYRDPWTFGHKAFNKFGIFNMLLRFLQRKKEIHLLEQTFMITTVSETLKSYFPSEFQHKIHVIPNGSNYIKADIKPKEDKTFNIVYTGTIYNDQLQDNTFFLALKQFLYQKDQENIKLQFLGSFYTTALKAKIEEFGLSHITTITKRLKKDELLPYLNNANIFLHLKYGDRSGIITSKQADYLFFRRPILLPVSDKGDLAESISKHKAGYICNDQAEIVGTLNMLYSKFLNGEVVEIVQSEEMLKYNSREAIAERFVDLILENK